MLFPVPRFYAERSALARDLRTRLSIFTALIPRCTRGPPIFSTSSLMGTLMTFGITPARSSSVHVWQSYFRPAWAIRCNCSRPTGSTGGSLLHRSRAQGLDRLIQPAFIRMPGSHRLCCSNRRARR